MPFKVEANPPVATSEEEKGDPLTTSEQMKINGNVVDPAQKEFPLLKLIPSAEPPLTFYPSKEWLFEDAVNEAITNN